MNTDQTKMTIIKDIYTGKFRVSLVEDPAFLSAIEGLQSFVLDCQADCDMAYDWVCEQAGTASFVADNYAWDMFFDAYNRAADMDWLINT